MGAKAIQSVFRRRKAQEQVHSMKNKKQEEKEKSAIKMQAVIRGRAKRKEKKELNISATKLQARFRGKQARIKVQDVSEEKYDAWRKKRCVAIFVSIKRS